MNAYGLYGELGECTGSCRHPSSRVALWIDAAAIWMQYLTAYGALIDIGDLTSGETVLIPAASSSVGLAAIQIANKVDAIPIAPDARPVEAEGSARRGGCPRHRHRRARPGQGGSRDHRRQRGPHGRSTRSADRH